MQLIDTEGATANNEVAEQEQERPTVGARALPGGLAAAVHLQTHALICETSPDGRDPEGIDEHSAGSSNNRANKLPARLTGGDTTGGIKEVVAVPEKT
jgi:hypothetical protein